MNKFTKKLLISSFSTVTISILLFNSVTIYCSNTEGSIVQSNPFWMPLEFDIDSGYFKANVFIAGLKEETGLLKVCVIPQVTKHKLCHYMNAVEEEGQIIAPYVSAHAGIYIFPSSQVPVDTDVNVCVTIIKDPKMLCKTIRNSAETREELVDLNLGGQAS